MEDRIRSLLEEYNISQLLLMLDIPEEEMLELMVNYGLIEWERLEDEIQWPVSCLSQSTDSGESQINDNED